MGIARQTLLWASRNQWLARQFQQRGFTRRAASRFIPGEDLDAALGAAKVMQPGGRIINMGSVNGEAALFPGASFYSGTKGAIRLLSQGWARDLAGRSITVNTIQNLWMFVQNLAYPLVLFAILAYRFGKFAIATSKRQNPFPLSTHPCSPSMLCGNNSGG